MATSHIKNDFLDIFKKYKQKFVLIPGSLTRILQPLDVNINAPIKKAMINIYIQYCINAGRILGKIKKEIEWITE